MTAVATLPTSSSVAPPQVWLRARGVPLAFRLLVIAAIALASARSGDQHGRLGPRSANRYGSRAVAELLKDHGVSVRVVTTLKDAASVTGTDATLLVTAPNLLMPHQQTTLRAATTATAGRTVLLGAGCASVGTLAPGVHAEPSTSVAPRPPG